VALWEAREGSGWALDLDELRRAIRPNTKAIIINTPHNPTGYLMGREPFGAVHRIADENGIVVFSDEVYRESEHQENDRLPAACDLSEHAVSLGVMSKTYGLAGLRIGWAATRNRELLTTMAALKDYTTICNSAPSEFLAELALRHRAALIERNVSIIRRNLTRLDGFFERRADRFVWQRPTAGPIAFPRLIDRDIERFCSELVNATGVLLLPGTAYGHLGNHFRIGFGRENLPEAVDRFEAFLDHER
jgi:aspartate/methionine/tyrosine aminotransferase